MLVAEQMNTLTNALGVEMRLRFLTMREMKFGDGIPERVLPHHFRTELDKFLEGTAQHEKNGS